jgi:hypothetical protein
LFRRWITKSSSSPKHTTCWGKQIQETQFCQAHKNRSANLLASWRAPWSRGEPTWGFTKVKLRKVGTEGARSWLPTLERGRGWSWKPRD